MALPLLTIASGLLSLLPKAREVYDAVKGGNKYEAAEKVVSLAQGALASAGISTDGVPPEEYESMLKASAAARIALQKREAEFVQELKLAYFADLKDARSYYKETRTLVNEMARKVMGQSVYGVLFLIAVQVGCIYLFRDNGVVLALIGNLIGVVVGQLLGERLQVLNYLFGTAIDSESRAEANKDLAKQLQGKGEK